MTSHVAPRSLVFWNTKEICTWLSNCPMPPGVVEEARRQKVNGGMLIGLVNSGSLSDIGLTSSMKISQIIWNLERRIKEHGDEGCKIAIDPNVFEGVPGRLQGQGSMSNMSQQFGTLSTKEEGEDEPKPPPPPVVVDLLSMSPVSSPKSGGGGGGGEGEAGEGEETKKKKKKKMGKNGKAQFSLIDFGDEDGEVGGEDEEGEEEEDDGLPEATPVALEFDVVFEKDKTPNVLLEEFQPGNRLIVKGFPRKPNGEKGNAELTGKIMKGDFLLAANGLLLSGFQFPEAIQLLTDQPYPLRLRFQRMPAHLRAISFESWSVNALRSVLLEEGLPLTGLERHAELVSMAKRAFWKKPPPLPPAPPKVEPGATAMLNGDTSIAGWLLLKTPYDAEHQRMFCDLHGSELLYHKPRGEGGAEYESEAKGSIDMSKIKLVATTRSSEEGQKDLRMVDNDGQVYLISAATEAALFRWMKKLSTAQIIGPESRTSGSAEPSAPYLVSKSANSLTIMWLPPRLPYLNSVFSFQVEMRVGAPLVNRWRIVADEVHSTKLVVKGLQFGDKHYFRVRGYHELDRGNMTWGEFGDTSEAFVTERELNKSSKPPVHLWVLVHGLRGDPDDLDFMAEALNTRFSYDSVVMVSKLNGGMLQTLDGIDACGQRLQSEVMLELARRPSIKYLSFVGHGVGGLYIRYALRGMDERGAFVGGHLTPLNFISLGCPHMGTNLSKGGVIGFALDRPTTSQLKLKDGDARHPDPDRHPLILQMCQESYLRPLELFHRRALYSNVRFDSTVEYASSAIRAENPYEGVSDRHMQQLISPHYQHILLASAANKGFSVVGAGGMGGGGAYAKDLANLCGLSSVWEMGRASLDSVGWERVDVFNPDGLMPYDDLVVASDWRNVEGFDTVRHLVDRSLGKPSDAEKIAQMDAAREEATSFNSSSSSASAAGLQTQHMEQSSR